MNGLCEDIEQNLGSHRRQRLDKFQFPENFTAFCEKTPKVTQGEGEKVQCASWKTGFEINPDQDLIRSYSTIWGNSSKQKCGTFLASPWMHIADLL